MTHHDIFVSFFSFLVHLGQTNVFCTWRDLGAILDFTNTRIRWAFKASVIEATARQGKAMAA